MIILNKGNSFQKKKKMPWKSRGTKDQLLIDKTFLKDCKKRHTNSSVAWIDYKKAYEFVLHSLISECMNLFEIADNVRNFLEKSMEQ